MVFWILLGLLGGTRVQNLHGHGVLTFHMPFIIAATALGGPVAGGWVAVFATFEAREFREVPWYGMLANHAAIAVSAVLAGIVFDFVRNGPLGFDRGPGRRPPNSSPSSRPRSCCPACPRRSRPAPSSCATA